MRTRLISLVALAVLGTVAGPASAAAGASSRVRGAGFVVPYARAHGGALHVVVPKLRCAAHENSELGVRVVIMNSSRVSNGWSGGVAFRCSNGHPQYDGSLECGGRRAPFGRAYPGDAITISYKSGGVDIDDARGNGVVGAGCSGTSRGGQSPAADHRQVGFFVTTSSRPPKSLQSLKVHVTVDGKKLSSAHPTRQSQSLNTKVLRPGRIAADGRTFTARVRWR